MPKVFLYGPVAGQSITLTADNPAADGSYTVRTLNLPKSAPFTLDPPLTIDHKFTEPIGVGPDIRLKQADDGSSFSVSASYALTGAGDFQWFGQKFGGAIALVAELAIEIPGTGAAPKPDSPFIAIRLCGAFQVGVDGAGQALFTSNVFCCQVEIAEIPPLPSSAPSPGFRLRLPSLGIGFPRLSLPWNFPDFPSLPFRLPGFALPAIGSLIPVSYASVDANVDITTGVVTIDIHDLRIGNNGAIEADLHIVFDVHGGIDTAHSFFHLYRPDFAHTTTIPVSNWNIGKGCLVVGWKSDRLQDLLSLVLPDFNAHLDVSEVVLRILSGANGITEVRLDWAPPSPATFSLPGFDVNIEQGTFSLVADLADTNDQRLLLAVTLPASGKVTATSTFSFARGTNTPGQNSQTELQHGDNTTDPFVTFTAPAATAVTVLLADLPLGGAKGMQFLRQLQTSLTPLVPFRADCTALVHSPVSLQPASWGAVTLAFNTNALHLPFLRNEDSGASQFLSVTGPGAVTLTLGNDPVAPIPLTITVKVGDLSFATKVTLQFHLESFAFTIDDSDIPFVLKSTASGDLFGLKWNVLSTTGQTQDFEVFRLQTKGSNYQLRQSPGCVFQLAYSAATSEGQPIIFTVSNLAIGPRGIDLDAAVAPRPARLSGVDTEFTFTQGSFQIRSSRIQDFSIAGSGPLPPALVGSASASIALQFHQPPDGSSLKLVSGAARLDGKNLLKCQGTRFQFSVDALGLKFVEDAGYHLYFTVTGTARFVLQGGDDPSGPLAWLPNIELRLMECPLTGDARIISQHVQFLVELPRKVTFSILGCFEMEVRGIGFVPQAPMFDATASAMRLAGQIRFADGDGDALDARIDFHDLFVGLPAPGGFFPRIYCKELGVKLKVADAFDLSGLVDFLDNEEIQPGVIASGFRGQGSLTIQGLPTLSVSFAFLRVRAAGSSTWDRAWFLYAQIGKVSFEIPVIEIFIREIGLGFGYRYTLAMIQASDTIQDPKELIRQLEQLSLSQGDLASFDQWRVDDGGPGDPRWTVVFRAMIAESSATQVPTEWIEEDEREIPCLFLLDTVVALRSDLTFLMTARGWLFTNYWDYVNDTNGVKRAPLVTGFVLLSPRQSRFLAHVASNPGAQIGGHPPVPDIFMSAFRSCHYSATLLVQPGLFHAEIGWPNQLTWGMSLGPIHIECSGGAIFRCSTTEIVSGLSFQARGSLELAARVDLGFIGAQLSATAQVAMGARYIAVLALRDTVRNSAYYSVQGIDIQVRVSIQFWIKIDVLFGTIEIDFSFSFAIAFSASLQLGILLTPAIGVRAAATVGINIMGHGLNFGISMAAFPDVVDRARSITDKFLNVGLESSDALPIPGDPPVPLGDPPPAQTAKPSDLEPPAHAEAAAAAHAAAPPVAPPPASTNSAKTPNAATAAVIRGIPPATGTFITPNYSIFLAPPTGDQGYYYLVLIPSATRVPGSDTKLGFLAPPPVTLKGGAPFTPAADFEWTLPNGPVSGLLQFDPVSGAFSKDCSAMAAITWQAGWDLPIGTFTDSARKTSTIHLRETLRYAYTLSDTAKKFGDVTPIDDPLWSPNSKTPTRDDRLDNANESAYEAAVRGAADQVSSPRFRPDPNSPFDTHASQAWSFQTSIYQSSEEAAPESTPQAVQMRSATIHQMVRDVAALAAEAPDPSKPLPGKPVAVSQSVAFRAGLVFCIAKDKAPAWLIHGGDIDSAGTIKQRTKLDSDTPDSPQPGKVSVFNTDNDRFDNPRRPPVFDKVRQFSDDNTIAISWDLVWPETTAGDPHSDPEHHLGYYLVRRKPLDDSERATEYQVRPADVLLRKKDGASELTAIRTRFHILDHFNNETAEAQAQLPPTGKSYIYTVTPYDIAGHASPRPLSLVATRYPRLAPLVPSDAEMMVTFAVPSDGPVNNLTSPVLQEIADPVLVFFTQPVTPQGSPRVEVKSYRLWFRREQAMPIGSYGLGSSAQGSQAKGLPASNARQMRTDIEIDLAPIENPNKSTGDLRKCYSAKLADLKKFEIVAADGVWRPDSWLIFLQAASGSEVWSSLAPVQPVLAFTRGANPMPVLRRPAVLEFISKPVAFSPLPPEDARARTGYAEVPMPGEAPLDLTADPASRIKYQLHPERPRAIEFVWNQAPSESGVPPDLQAGFDLYELDLDAHTSADLADADSIEANLRLIQQVELLPRDQVAMVPPDTQQTQRWEAWYAASLTRNKAALDQKLNATYGNWYSWRDSEIIWPPAAGGSAWPVLPAAPQTKQDMFAAAKMPRMHPFLQSVVDALPALPPPRLRPDSVEVVPIPVSNITDLDGFMQETAESTDPYGWRLLQRFGLSICFRMRDGNTGDPVDAAKTLARLQTVLPGCLTDFPGIAQHLHLELLFQPGKSVTLQDGAADSGSLLDAVQLSLRPTVRQVFFYSTVDITANQPGLGAQLTLRFAMADGTALAGSVTICSVASLSTSADQTSQPFGQSIVDPANPVLTLGTPASGKLTLLMRYRGDASKLSVKADGATIGAVTSFGVTDRRTNFFTVADWLDSELTDTAVDVAAQWKLLGTYLRMAKNSSVPGPDNVRLPDSLKTRPDLLPWLQRFLDYAQPEPLSAKDATPWLATAYPRLVSPLPAVPDDAGRITCLHLVTDEYAHTWRYHVRARGRYDALWQAVVASPPFSTGDTSTGVTPVGALSFSKPPDPNVGGLDVVLDRVREVAQPLILGSRLINLPAAKAGDPQQPGVWEVIVARHPEQALAERNWTAARQLAWSRLAWTLMRTFGFQPSRAQLNALLKNSLSGNYTYEVQPVENLPDRSLPLLPGDYPPPEQERLKFVPGGDTPAVDFPLRIREFGKGALVVQYRGMPYFYKQQFVVAAQAGRVVSKESRVVQQDFEYMSPAPLAWMDATDDNKVPGRSRLVNVQLASYWDCCPPHVQTQWPMEEPKEHDPVPINTPPKRKYSSLPDTAVLYDLVFHRSAGVSEAVAEFYFDPSNSSNPIYNVRILNKDVAINPPGVRIPQAAQDRHAPMILTANMPTGELTRRANMLDRLRIPDLHAIASCPDATAEDKVTGAFVDRWFPARGVSKVVDLPNTPEWQAAVEFRLTDRWVLASDADATTSQPVSDWANTLDDGLKATILSLKAGVPTTIKPFLAASDLPVPLRHSIEVSLESVTWSGASSDALLKQFDDLLPSLALNSPGRTSLTALRAQLNPVTSQPTAPQAFDGPMPKKDALAALLANPLTHLNIAGADAAWTISNNGINLGEPSDVLLDRLVAAIPDANDNRRKALTAVFTAVAAFSATAQIPGVPPGLAAHVLLAPWLLHLRTPLPPNADLVALFPAQPDKDSIARLLHDVAEFQTFGQTLAQWTSEEAISSRNAFTQPDAWQDRMDFPAPDACQLHIEGKLSPNEANQLLAVQADSEFNDALAQLAAGKAQTVRVTVGIEQIAEIQRTATLPTAANRKLTWHGTLSPAQFLALNRWVQISTFRATFSALLDALAGWPFHADFDKAQAYPRTSELPPALAGRLITGPAALDWKGGLALDTDQDSALQDLVNDASFDHSFHAAVSDLLDALRHTASVTVAVKEDGWVPRPRTGDLLPDKLLIGNGRVRTFGLMTRAEARAQASGKTPPDQAAVARLFNDSTATGLGGAQIAVRARLGSADLREAPLITDLAQGG